MRDNCGIIALDALLKSMSLNMSRISLDTLSKICRDNGRLMFPIKVPKSKVRSLAFPYIVQTNNHYEAIEDETALEGLEFEDIVYMLYPQLNTQIIPHVIDEEEAKQVKGACNEAANIPVIGPFISKPGRLLPMAIGAGSQMLGLGPTMGNILSTAAGAGQGASTGLWGQKGSAGAILGGGAAGLGTGMVGRGLGTGLSNAFASYPGATDVNRLGVFKTGFTQGFGESIPFGQKLGLYKPTPSFTPSAIPQTNFNTPTTGGMPPTPPSNQVDKTFTTPQGIGKEPSSKWGEALPYLLSGAGALIPQPPYEGISESDIQRRLSTTATPTGEIATAKINEYMLHPENIGGQATQNYLTSLDADLAQREQRELAWKKADLEARGYNAYGTDYNTAMNQLLEDQRIRRDSTMNAVRNQVWQQQVDMQIRYISQAYGIDAATVQELLNMDVYQASIKYGIDAEKINQLRQTIYNMALMSYQSQLQKTTNQQMIEQMQALYGGK